MDRLYVYSEANHERIADNVSVANTFFNRFIGLMFKKQLIVGEGLYIEPCKQVHTHFMKFNVDVIFLDQQMRVIHIEHNMKPWRISKFYKAANAVLELAQDQALTIKSGDQLRFEKES